MIISLAEVKARIGISDLSEESEMMAKLNRIKQNTNGK